MIRLTADDYGIGDAQDALVRDLAMEGCIQGISAFAGPLRHFDVLTSITGLSLGLHLNLTDGGPSAPPEKVPTLLDEAGHFLGAKAFPRRLLMRRIRQKEIQIEIRAQIHRYLEAGGRLDHIDTHRHIHRFLPVLRALLQELEIEATRPIIRSLERRIFDAQTGACGLRPTTAYLMQRPGRCVTILLKHWQRRRIDRSGLTQTAGLLTPINQLPADTSSAAEVWSRAMERVGTGQWEANFHPGWIPKEAELLRQIRST